MTDNGRTGVFVCECGDRMASALNVPALVEQAARLPHVDWVEAARYWCLPQSLARIRSIVTQEHLDRCVVAGCAPRTHDVVFRRALDGAVHPALISVLNLRDLCAAPHVDDAPGAMRKAADQIAMAAADLIQRQAGMPRRARITPHVVVIGGGIAGLTAALSVSDAGIPVTLVERKMELGGQAKQAATDRIAAIRARPNVQLLTNTHPVDIRGTIGRYEIQLSNGEMIDAGAIVVAAGAPGTDRSSNTDHRLAEMLRLSVDLNGFTADLRTRLRPADRVERGIYICGAVHGPCNVDRAVFQAYSAAARAIQHIPRREITNWSPAATVDVARCNGCGDCARVCPFDAIALTRRNSTGGAVRTAAIDSLLCQGCGNCVSVCPVQAAQMPSASDEQIEATMAAALGSARREAASGTPVLIFACEWSGYSAAELAGARKLSYPACTRVIRVNCTGRLQPGLLLKAIEMGAAGVLVLGCEPQVCHYEQGNEHAAVVFEHARGLGHLLRWDKRIGLKWIPPDDGAAFVAAVQDFVDGVKTRT